MEALIQAFILVFVAEMGDKSQLLALAFATRYPLRTVLAGVSLGIALNHGVAILAAYFISQYFPIESLKLLSGAVFLAFGLKSLWVDGEEEEEKERFGQLGPILAMASTFFLGEFGDKTQITAMTLAVAHPRPFLIFLSTVSAMIAVSLIGIFVGKVLGKKIPEVTMQLASGGLFLFFGMSTLFEEFPEVPWKTPFLIVLMAVLFLGAAAILRRNARVREEQMARDLTELLAGCKGCSEHNPACPRAKAINAMTRKYLGEDVPYLGNMVSYLEGMRSVSQGKRDVIIEGLQKRP